MSASTYTTRLARTLVWTTQETANVAHLVRHIRRSEATLKNLQYNREVVRSEISTWDRINILKKTKHERTESDLNQRIDLIKKGLKHNHAQLDQMLLSVFFDLTGSNPEFHSVLLWDTAKQLNEAIKNISAGGCSEGTARVYGKPKALTINNNLFMALNQPEDPTITVDILIALAKSDLLRSR
ncbi:MAG: hypothetical protein ACFFAL_08770 [Promethearchaeota archaeon]